MRIDFDKVREELKLRSFGQKGWLYNKKIPCPFCGREGKFGFLQVGDSGLINCFFCSEKTSLYNYLKLINRIDLVNKEVEVSFSYKMKSIREIKEEADEENSTIKELEEIKLPHKIIYIEEDEYLDGRGFLKEHYDLFEPCFTQSILERKLHNYIIFKIKQEGKVVSWLARSRYSYEWHKENLEKSKKNECKLTLRYRNSDGTEFNKILGGYDDITDNTTTIILVEGLFDKVGVDSKMMLYLTEEIRCCFTFGNNISDDQIKLLKKKSNIKNVILFYDYGTISQSKSSSLRLSKNFDTLVGVPETEEDAGSMNFDDMEKVFNNLKTPMEFYLNNL